MGGGVLDSMQNDTLARCVRLKKQTWAAPKMGRATFRKMPEAGLKIAQKGLKNTFFCQNFAEAPSLGRVFRILGGLNPPPTPMYVKKAIFGRA